MGRLESESLLAQYENLSLRLERLNGTSLATRRLILRFFREVPPFQNDEYIEEACQILLLLVTEGGDQICPQQSNFEGKNFFHWEDLAKHTDFTSVVNHVLAHALTQIQILRSGIDLENLR